MTRKLVLLLTLCHGALAAQQQPLAGTWQVTFQAGMRIEDGEATPIMATGTLTIEAGSDSLIGTPGDQPRVRTCRRGRPFASPPRRVPAKPRSSAHGEGHHQHQWRRARGGRGEYLGAAGEG